MSDLLNLMMDEIEAEIKSPGTRDDIEAVWDAVYSMVLPGSRSHQRLARLEEEWDGLDKRLAIADLVRIVSS